MGSQEIEDALLKKLKMIREHGLNNRISNEEMRKNILYKFNMKSTKSERKTIGWLPTNKNLLFLSLIILPTWAGLLAWFTNSNFSLSEMWDDIFYSRCLIELSGNTVLQEVTRPIVNCSICEGLKSFPQHDELTRDEFVLRYAYSGVPVLVRGAMAGWTALDTFNFTYFRDLYTNTPGALHSVEQECQFFSYKTKFTSLREVFEMPADRAAFKDGEKKWYIGWSNCDPVVSKQLRKHYKRPYFLPEQTEDSVLDWIFMGGFGPGAMIHIDYVGRPSWQAQVSGTKRWTLIPPPECEHVCETLSVSVRKGDIVCINTNEWYHDTYIEEGEMSITIGSEYD